MRASHRLDAERLAARRWICLLIVAAYFVFFRVTSTLALRYCNFLRR
jgi:hypothetical protein